MSPIALLILYLLFALASLPGPGAIDFWMWHHDLRDVHPPHAEELE